MDRLELIGNNLRFLREANGYTPKELSAELGFSVSSISEYEYGKHLKPETLLKYSQFYDISLDRLTGENLSNSLVLDYYYQNSTALMELIELFLPTAQSELAMKNADFKEGWRNLEIIIDFWKDERDCDNHLIENGFKCFARSAVYDSLAEGAINALKLYVFMDGLVLEETMDSFIKTELPFRANDSLMKKYRRLLLCNNEKVIAKRNELAKEWGWMIPVLLETAKKNDKWRELVDYYDAMLRIIGVNNGGSFVKLNRDVGMNDMLRLWQKENLYVKQLMSFCVTNCSITAADAEQVELLKGVII